MTRINDSFVTQQCVKSIIRDFGLRNKAYKIMSILNDYLEEREDMSNIGKEFNTCLVNLIDSLPDRIDGYTAIDDKIILPVDKYRELIAKTSTVNTILNKEEKEIVNNEELISVFNLTKYILPKKYIEYFSINPTSTKYIFSPDLIAYSNMGSLNIDREYYHILVKDILNTLIECYTQLRFDAVLLEKGNPLNEFLLSTRSINYSS